MIGIRESARFNATMVAIKLAAVLFFIVAGFKFVKPENWSPFAPYGWSGIMAAGAVVFFAYIGFDAVSTTAEEAKNPSRDLPIGIISSLVICTVLYIVVAAILSGIVPVTHFRTRRRRRCPARRSCRSRESTAFLNAPVAYALHVIDQDWAAGLISAGAVAGITQRAARHADGPAAHLLLDEPRPAAAGGREQGPPPLRHALHHDDHHRASWWPSSPASSRSTSSAR